MSQPLIFFDLDRTLYRTTLGVISKWQKIGQEYPHIDVDTEHGRQRSFFRYSADMYTYDFTSHISAVGLDVDVVYEMLRTSELADGRLEYEGAGELVAWAQSQGAVKVLTYGINDYQRLKAALCPSLRNIEVVTTLNPKSDYLKGRGDAWLVDDKPIGDALPKNVRFIQACLEGQEAPAGSSWPVVKFLSQVRDIMQQPGA